MSPSITTNYTVNNISIISLIPNFSYNILDHRYSSIILLLKTMSFFHLGYSNISLM